MSRQPNAPRRAAPAAAPPYQRLADEINRAHTACVEAERSALGHALHAGELLLDVKHRVGHGAFLAWQEAHCRFTPRTAQLYMALARELGTKYETVSHLTLREALAQLRQPGTPLWLRPPKQLVVAIGFASSAEHARFWHLLHELHAQGDPAPVLVRALECYRESQDFPGAASA